MRQSVRATVVLALTCWWVPIAASAQQDPTEPAGRIEIEYRGERRAFAFVDEPSGGHSIRWTRSEAGGAEEVTGAERYRIIGVGEEQESEALSGKRSIDEPSSQSWRIYFDTLRLVSRHPDRNRRRMLPFRIEIIVEIAGSAAPLVTSETFAVDAAYEKGEVNFTANLRGQQGIVLAETAAYFSRYLNPSEATTLVQGDRVTIEKDQDFLFYHEGRLNAPHVYFQVTLEDGRTAWVRALDVVASLPEATGDVFYLTHYAGLAAALSPVDKTVITGSYIYLGDPIDEYPMSEELRVPLFYAPKGRFTFYRILRVEATETPDQYKLELRYVSGFLHTGNAAGSDKELIIDFSTPARAARDLWEALWDGVGRPSEAPQAQLLGADRLTEA